MHHPPRTLATLPEPNELRRHPQLATLTVLDVALAAAVHALASVEPNLDRIRAPSADADQLGDHARAQEHLARTILALATALRIALRSYRRCPHDPGFEQQFEEDIPY
jgi:hypothetical protein